MNPFYGQVSAKSEEAKANVGPGYDLEELQKDEDFSLYIDDALYEEVESVANEVGEYIETNKKGHLTMDAKAVKSKFGKDVYKVFKLGIAQINNDIKKDIVSYDEEKSVIVPGENYEPPQQDAGDVQVKSCSWSGLGKAVVSAGVGGAVGGAITGSFAGGVGAGPGAAAGGAGGAASGAAGYAATCWW